MRRRGAVPLAILLLSACQDPDAPIAGSRPLDCRLADKPDFEPGCTIERVTSPEGPVLVARRGDGSFRRLLIVKDGRGVIAADGAEPVAVRPADEDHIEVTAGDMVYRLPAKIAP